MLWAAGCDGNHASSAPSTPERPVQTVPAPTQTAPPSTHTQTTTSPENQPGGAGDEEPVRTQALVIGRGGRISPRVVRVPPFIAVRLELRSGDGRSYGLRVAGRALRVGPERHSDSVLLDGIGHGERCVARPVGAGNRATMEATAEPGP